MIKCSWKNVQSCWHNNNVESYTFRERELLIRVVFFTFAMWYHWPLEHRVIWLWLVCASVWALSYVRMSDWAVTRPEAPQCPRHPRHHEPWHSRHSRHHTDNKLWPWRTERQTGKPQSKCSFYCRIKGIKYFDLNIKEKEWAWTFLLLENIKFTLI